MPNSTKYLRSITKIKPTTRGGGLETTITVRAYDNGVVSVNGDAVCGPLHNNPARYSEACVSMLATEIVVLLLNDAAKRRNQLKEQRNENHQSV